MPSKPIMIGALEFPSRGDAYAFLKGILARYDVGDKVNAADSAIYVTHSPCTPKPPPRSTAASSPSACEPPISGPNASG
jgi:hypothetical protein